MRQSHSWTLIYTETYDRLLTDIFSVQDELTMSVIGAIEPSLRAVEIERVKRKRPDNLDAYDLVLRSLPFMRDKMVDGAAAAIPLLQTALRLEPDYALAHAVMARCFHIRFSRGGFNEVDRAASIYHAHSAIIVGTDDATALAIAALVIWFDEHDITTALDLFDRALAISSSNVTALSNSALAMAWMGKTDIAIERAQRALRLSPFDTHNSYMALAVTYFHIRRYREAREAALRAVNSNPGFSVPQALLAAALVGLNEIDQAKVVVQRVLELQPNFSIKGFSITNGQAPDVYIPFAKAWSEAGMPRE